MRLFYVFLCMMCQYTVLSQTCIDNSYNITVEMGDLYRVSKVAYFDFDMTGVRLMNNLIVSHNCSFSSQGVFDCEGNMGNFVQLVVNVPKYITNSLTSPNNIIGHGDIFQSSIFLDLLPMSPPSPPPSSPPSPPPSPPPPSPPPPSLPLPPSPPPSNPPPMLPPPSPPPHIELYVADPAIESYLNSSEVVSGQTASNLTIWAEFTYEIRLIGTHPVFPNDGVRWVNVTSECEDFTPSVGYLTNGSLDENFGVYVRLPQRCIQTMS